MDIFLFILSFISGGVVLTVAYNAYITTTIRVRYNSLLSLQKELENVQNEQFVQTDKMIKEIVANIKATREQMQADNYASLGELNEELNKLKLSISSIREDLEADRKINEGEFRKLGGNIQNTIGMINAVKEDKNFLSKY